MRLIDADALSRALAEMWYDSPISVTGASVSELINKQPTIEADRPKGEWIDTGKDKDHLHPLSARWYRCSVCGLETNTKSNFCFDCGADMRGEDNAD